MLAPRSAGGWRRSKKRLPDGTQERVFVRESDPDSPSPAREPQAPAASEFQAPLPLFPLVADEVPEAGTAEEHAGNCLARDARTAPAGDAPGAAAETVAAEAADAGVVLDEEVRVVNYDFMLQ